MYKIEIINDIVDIKEILDEFEIALLSLSKGDKYRQNMAKKFIKNGVFISCKENSEVIGFAAFYCNDMINKIGYLSMIAVIPEMRKKGVGKCLLSFVENYSLMNNMNQIKLEVNKTNNIAIAFYRKNGYEKLLDSNETSYYLRKKLEKK